MPEERRQSKYGQKFAARRRADGGSERPYPRPMDPDYQPKHYPKPVIRVDERGKVHWRGSEYVHGAIIYDLPNNQGKTYRMPKAQ